MCRQYVRRPNLQHHLINFPISIILTILLNNSSQQFFLRILITNFNWPLVYLLLSIDSHTNSYQGCQYFSSLVLVNLLSIIFLFSAPYPKPFPSSSQHWRAVSPTLRIRSIFSSPAWPITLWVANLRLCRVWLAWYLGNSKDGCLF